MADSTDNMSIQIHTLQPSSDIIINEGKTIQEAAIGNPYNIPGFKETTNFRPNYAFQQGEPKKKRLINKFFSDMSRLGMDVGDDVIANMRAIPADKNLIPKPEMMQLNDLFANNNWKVKTNRDKSFFEKDFTTKRDVLRRLALQPELEDILDTMANEAIVYDSNYSYFLEPYIDPKDLKEVKKSFANKLQKDIDIVFSRLYKMLGWKTKAWDDFKRFLIEGELAWEIVYDSLQKPTRIIGLISIDVATLTRKYDNGKWYWIQYKGCNGKERKLLDSQIVYIQYQETNCVARMSYLERLIRPFNIYRIVEQAQLIWTITNSSYRMQFTIPTAGMGKALGEQTLNTMMNRYKENIKFNSDSGELTYNGQVGLNGQVNMPFNKEYWLPSNEAGNPEIQTLGGDGPDLNDNDQLKYFKNQLYLMSKIPLSRFDQEGGATWFGTDASSWERAEISFARFVDRLRNTFAQIILKPLILQISLDIPEMKDYKDILNSISMQFKTYNPFEEMLELEVMQKRVEAIQTMKDSLEDETPDGNSVKFFSNKYLVSKYLHMSNADFDLNKKYKKEEQEEYNLAGDDSSSSELEGQDPEIATLLEEIKEKRKKLADLKKAKQTPPKNEEEE